MENCIFCKIANGDIPANIVKENDDFIAFLDINPCNPGHTLVIPKKHSRWVWDVENFGQYLEFTKDIAKAIQKAMKTEWVVMGVAGNEVEHAHIHLVPRFDNDNHGGFIKPELTKKLPSEEMKDIAEKITKSL